MKYLKFENVSWHWQLAHVYGPLYDNGEGTRTFNICQYARAVLFGAIVVTFVAAAGGILVSYVGSVIVWGVAMAVSASYISPNLTTVVAILTSGIFGCVWSLIMIERVFTYQVSKFNATLAASRAKRVTEPGFIKQWYKSVKDKTCVDITIHTNPQ